MHTWFRKSKEQLLHESVKYKCGKNIVEMDQNEYFFKKMGGGEN
jgi:hypothetical protein